MRRRLSSAILLLAAGALLAAAPARAASSGGKGGGGIRAALSLGAWRGVFTEAARGRELSLASPVSPAFQMRLGFRVSALFIEYAPYWNMSPMGQPLESDPTTGGHAHAYSALSGNVGLFFSGLQAEIYVGGASAYYDFDNGADTRYRGPSARVGLMFPIVSEGFATIGIQAEATRLFVSGDERGNIPSGIIARADSLFLGICARLAN